MRHSVRQGPQQLEAGARDCSHPRIPSQIPLKPQTIPDSSNPKSGQLSPRLGPETETQTRPAKCCCMMPRSCPQSSARQLRASADAQEAAKSWENERQQKTLRLDHEQDAATQLNLQLFSCRALTPQGGIRRPTTRPPSRLKHI